MNSVYRHQPHQPLHTTYILPTTMAVQVQTNPLVGPYLCSNLTKCDKDAPFQCGRCRGVHYCSVQCQKEHRSAHKEDCVPGRGTTSALAIEHDQYVEMMEKTKKEGPKEGEETYLILRRNGHLYWVPDGSLLLDSSKIKGWTSFVEQATAAQQPLKNKGRHY